MVKTTKRSATAKPKSTRSKTSRVASRQLPGYRAFTKRVLAEILKHRNVFGPLVAVVFAAVFLASGITQQGVYAGLTESTSEVSGALSGGLLKTSVEVGALFMSVVSGALTSGLSEGQQLYMALIYLFAWLTTVWLLRHLLAGNNVTMRDGLYSAGAPLLSTLLIGIVMLVQVLPFAIAATIFSTLSASAVLSGWLYFPAILIILALGALTLYWLAGSFFAAIVVTIPGTYPRAALQSAKGLIAGRRIELIKRIVWLLGLSFIIGFIALIPVIMFDSILGYPFTWIVVAWVIMVGVSVFIYSSAYIYMIYRGIIDERA